MPARERLHIGTSGWVYRAWRGPFYPADLPAKKQFAFLASRFHTVEVNGTFYRLPSAAAIAAWREQAPPGFLYAVKASRFITHNKKLAEPRETLKRFLDLVLPLGPRLGPLLFQLPPTWHCDAARLEAFLGALRERVPRHAVTVEFRHPSWFTEAVYAVLRQHDAAFCICHLVGSESPLVVTARTVYLRLHGRSGKYAGAYGRDGLEPWCQRIRGWLDEEREVFCYFDNDIGAAAPGDALLMQEMLAG
jgi:uncharacterized protein YecE (DUF72 family)